MWYRVLGNGKYVFAVGVVQGRVDYINTGDMGNVVSLKPPYINEFFGMVRLVGTSAGGVGGNELGRRHCVAVWEETHSERQL